MINSLIASKLWYTAHIYPLPVEFLKLINTEIFNYIWNSKANPVKREILYRSKDKGGIGLLNIHSKSKSIFASTLLKSYTDSNDSSLIKHYLKEKFNRLLGIRNMQINRRHTPPYYEYGLDIIKKVIAHKDFPRLSSKEIYIQMDTGAVSNVESKYPNYDWANIWKNVGCRFMHVNDRPIIFKYIHGIIPTNKRLHQIRCRDNPI